MLRAALTIAGSDSGGGAGIQADLRTFAVFGVHGTSVITAVTAQNTREVRAIHPVPPDIITAQIDAVLDGIDVAAIKIGMLGNAEAIEAVAASLDGHTAHPVILDPVMIATTGARLLPETALDALVRLLIPKASLLTPNLGEAAALLGEPLARDEADMARQGTAILRMGAAAVLVKGGHAGGSESVDVLVYDGTVMRFSRPRISVTSTHGTGCTLSSAIAAGLANGDAMVDAIAAAKELVSRTIMTWGSGWPAAWTSDPNDAREQLPNPKKGTEMEERRVAARRRTLKGAHIVFNDGRSTITCIVRNLSATGALLRVETVLGVPHAFTLALDDGTKHQCRMLRWTATEIGVAFEET